jgi:hypothetical protein
MRIRFALTCGFAMLSTLAFGADPKSTSKVDFNRQVRPILSEKCFKCHGPDEAEREGGLRLDQRESALQPTDSGLLAIVPGKPHASSLIAKINSKRKSLVMPPAETNKSLTDAEKSTLAAWIEQGADYQTHWSFTKPLKPRLPTVKQSDWPKTPIDTFLLATMESKGLAPSPEADKPTLIRRITLDLTGLPPSSSEVDAFLADSSPKAFEKVVDRLLSNPRYGERMALDWLDAARYADTHGYHIDSGRDMTRWRDWVINAFNQNMPYDQFTLEQLAGDLLPNPTVDQKVASGFHRNHMINFEGGAVPEEYHNAYIVDRVNTTGTVWLGMTVGCAQCHDHKYDPITQKDYYRLYSFFHNVPENGLDGSKGNASPMIPVPSAIQAKEIESINTKSQSIEHKLNQPWPEVDKSQQEWEASASALKATAWRVANLSKLESRGKAKFTRQPDESVLVTGRNADKDVYVLTMPFAGEPLTGVRVEALPDASLKGGGPGRSVNGNIVMTDVKLEISTSDKPEVFKLVELVTSSADFSQPTFPVSFAIDTNPATGWGIDPEVGKAHFAIFGTKSALNFPKGSRLRLTLAFESQFAAHQLGRFRISTTSASDPHGKSAMPQAVASALTKPAAQRNADELALIRAHYRTEVSSEGKLLAKELASLRLERSKLESKIPTAMVMSEMTKGRDTFILRRGQYDQKAEKVTAGVPSFLPPLPPGTVPNRLAFARWLISPENPLVSRVTVNRLWQSFFGTGLVKSTEDFGSQGEQPSHPALLDWLAVEFLTPERAGAKPWDLKAMVRLFVTSAAYRQSSRVSPESLAKDPENRLLSHAPRYRLPAEFIRDLALSTSGLLDPKIGGASVSPYQPAGLWEELASRSDGKNWSAQEYVQSHGQDLYRRTMYTFWKRTSPPPTLVTFDAPDRETCTVRRGRTNTPLQALVLLNDPTYVEASRKLAERMMVEGGSTEESRVTFAFRQVLSRQPSPTELAILRDVYHEALVKFNKDRKSALKLLSVGESPSNSKLDSAELAAFSTVASVILNLDEAVTKG